MECVCGSGHKATHGTACLGRIRTLCFTYFHSMGLSVQGLRVNTRLQTCLSLFACMKHRINLTRHTECNVDATWGPAFSFRDGTEAIYSRLRNDSDVACAFGQILGLLVWGFYSRRLDPVACGLRAFLSRLSACVWQTLGPL